MRLANPAIRFNLILTAIVLVFNFFSASAQQSQVTDSIIQLYNKETSLPEKARLAGELSQIFMAIDTLSSEKWGNQAIEDAGTPAAETPAATPQEPAAQEPAPAQPAEQPATQGEAPAEPAEQPVTEEETPAQPAEEQPAAEQP